MNADFAAQRLKMVDGQVRTTDVTDQAILAAMLDVPREEFVGARLRNLAYIDEDILVGGEAGGAGRYLMEASPFARLVQLAAVKPSDVVLDVGCATGYSSAVLSRLASSVIAVESDATLADSASATLSKLGCDNVVVVQGALKDGYASEAPYDVIFVGGAVDAVPDKLLQQLKDGGRLVAVEGHGNAGVARLFLKTTGAVSKRRAFNAAIKPLPGFEREHAFEF